ncbi:MAG: SPOR domain-containing protein [Bacteroidetes bacterium]|nr:MAG: SPOR domain-containing protein [Bacteroidota bacterium]
MKMKLVLIVAVLLMFAGCKSKRMAAVDEPVRERPVIEKETDIAVEVDHTTGIMSLEERFTFARDEDKSRHDQKSYFVIIGSFRNRDNAERFKETIRMKGFEPVILLSETGLHRVSVDSYRMENDARARIMQIRSKFEEHADTWLLIRK